ncbi:MAG: hypothetical protein ABIH03_01725 [Pseudomonadota bacterium]
MHAPSCRALIIGALIVAVLAAPLARAQRRSDTPDQQIIREAQLVASGARVDLFQHDLVVDAGLVQAAERALAGMEELLGHKFDETTFGPRGRIYVSSSPSISHVWRGYEHPSDPKAVLFLNPRVARLGLRGTNATYAHELAHLLAWRFYSHTLREGLADYLALCIHPGAGVGPNIEGYASPPAVPAEVETYLGTARAPPAALKNDTRFRRAYYFASYRFVRFLIERDGMATFLKLYQARDPESEFPRLYRVPREELVVAAAR